MIALGDDASGTTNKPVNRLVKLNGWGEFTHGIFSRNYPSRAGAIGTVHDEGGNMALLDGHVEWAHWSKWIEFTDAATRRWNFDNQPHTEEWSP
jgi:prepilin-type processing-associated H-X9-DG protein